VAKKEGAKPAAAAKPVPKKVQEQYRKRQVGLGGVARELGVSGPVARRMLVESGVEIHGRGRPSAKPTTKPVTPKAPPVGLTDPPDYSG